MNKETVWGNEAAAFGTHSKAKKLAEDVIANLLKNNIPYIRALDFPCGAGSFSRELASMQCEVVSADIQKNELFVFDDSRFVLADGNETLPFDDNSFDLICSIEGIEHFENPSFFIRECFRVTKPGGYLLLSTPNVDSYSSKKRALFKGYVKFFMPIAEDEKESGHLLPVDMIFLKNRLKKAGFSLEKITHNDFRKGSGPSFLREIFRKVFASKWKFGLGEKVPFYGETLLYVARKP